MHIALLRRIGPMEFCRSQAWPVLLCPKALDQRLIVFLHLPSRVPECPIMTNRALTARNSGDGTALREQMVRRGRGWVSRRSPTLRPALKGLTGVPHGAAQAQDAAALDHHLGGA